MCTCTGSHIPAHSKYDGAVRHPQWLEALRCIMRASPHLRLCARTCLSSCVQIHGTTACVVFIYRSIETNPSRVTELCRHNIYLNAPIQGRPRSEHTEWHGLHDSGNKGLPTVGNTHCLGVKLGGGIRLSPTAVSRPTTRRVRLAVASLVRASVVGVNTEGALLPPCPHRKQGPAVQIANGLHPQHMDASALARAWCDREALSKRG